MTTQPSHQQQQQRSKNWNDMPYAALQLIADYHSVKASDALLVVGCVCKRWHDAAVNYLPADVWHRFYDYLVNVHYQIPEKQISEAKLPTPDTLQTYSDAARYWQPLIDDARALREAFRGVENMPGSWKVQALGTVAQWKGVSVASGRVTGVELTWNKLRGSVDLTKLPAGLVELWLLDNELNGVVDLTRLPASLVNLGINDNELSGSIDLTQLPAGLRGLYVNGNELSGSVDLTQLPAGLRSIYVNDNKLSGPIDLTRLPAGLQHVCLSSNEFSGSIDVTRLPASLMHLSINDNKFSGSMNLTQLPSLLEYLYLHNNKFDGSIDLTQLPGRLEYLHLDRNQFSGSIDLSRLPLAMKRIYLQDNKFAGSTLVNNNDCEVKVDDAVEITKQSTCCIA